MWGSTGRGATATTLWPEAEDQALGFRCQRGGVTARGSDATVYQFSLMATRSRGALRPGINGDSSLHVVPDYDDERNVFCESRLGPACRGSRC